MPGVIRNFQRGLKDVVWPQDTLQIPRGYGRMPAVDMVNSKRAKREYFALVASFENPLPNTITSVNVPIPKDGDFWMSSIGAMGFYDNAGAAAGLRANGTVQMTDVMSNYSFFVPSIPFKTIMIDPPSPFPLWFAPYPAGRVIYSNIPEPYCFLRGGAVKFDVTFNLLTTAAPVGVFQIILQGWKEYANAAT